MSKNKVFTIKKLQNCYLGSALRHSLCRVIYNITKYQHSDKLDVCDVA